MTEKEFILKHVFEDVEKLENEEELEGPDEQHFGVDWKINMEKYDNHLGIFLNTDMTEYQEITVDCSMKIVSKNKEKTCSMSISCAFEYQEYRGCPDFIDWKTLEDEYLDDGKLEVEVHVKITKMIEIPEGSLDELRSFGEDMKQFSDVILKINKHQISCSEYLSAHSPYFATLFLGKFQEAEKSEIELKDVDPQNFQDYLEVIYLEDGINDDTVEGILSVADMFDTPIIVEKCEKFLIENSEIELKDKLRLAGKYRLEELKKNCLDQIESKEDIRSVIPENPSGMDHEVLAELFKKLLDFN
ncbi:hypothetical protein B9Z55_007616 [Caenorhabditis nigoni]|nr:hypothetical protein B9Z55_007616 [Caenorhabditis nigoni]